MEHITIGKKYNEGKVAFVECTKNDKLTDINIKNKCFMLIVLTKGRLEFKIGGKRISASAPSFICFDETENPVLLSKSKAEYTCVYFHPRFLNINMTFDIIRADNYGDMATTHDMFLLRPFIDKAYVIPISENQFERIYQSAEYMQEELEIQRDWYWSCRGRAYFMEIIITLERMYGLTGYGFNEKEPDSTPMINNSKLRDAVLYIEGHYSENLTLSDISLNAGINQTTLTAFMKEEFGCTAMEYLMNFRIKVAKKQLEFTEIPIKDVASMVGFKTVQHFNRIFKEHSGTTPAEFRKTSVTKRKESFNNPK